MDKRKLTQVLVACSICALIILWLMPAFASPALRHGSARPAPTPKDIGVDWAEVTQATILFVQPSAASSHIAALRPRDLLFLVSRASSDGWMNVIQSVSGHQGWVRADRITLHFTQHRQQEVALDAVLTGATEPPALAVTNDSSGSVYLHLNQLNEITIPAHATKSVIVPAGVYSFNVAGAGAKPLFGHKVFVNGTTFTWRFYIGQGSQHSQNVSAAQRADIQQRQTEIDALAHAMAEERLKLDTEKVSLAQQEAAYQTAENALQAKRQTLDRTSQVAIDDFNSIVDATNDQLKSCQDAEARYNLDINDFNALLDKLQDKQKQLDAIADQINETH